MKLEFMSKSLTYLNNEPLKTLVVLGNSEGAYVPVLFDKDAIELTDAELYEKALTSLYEENFPERADKEKFKKVDEQLKKNTEKVVNNEQLIQQVTSVAEILISLALGTQGGMDLTSYNKLAEFISPLEPNKRYVNRDLVSMPYPFDTNPKWPKGTKTLFLFAIPVNDGYTYKNQSVQEMLQKGIISIVLPKLQ